MLPSEPQEATSEEDEEADLVAVEASATEAVVAVVASVIEAAVDLHQEVPHAADSEGSSPTSASKHELNTRDFIKITLE